MNNWSIAAWIIGAAIGLYALHRLALRLERDGWIRYLHHPPRGADGGGAAFGELQKFFEPQTRHVYEMKEQKRPLREADGGDPAERP
ncbi:MAG TPA: hypothetical protein VHR66_23265 [Gemmataceae bacterium]|jgi:hypothetical protein|nr:hypothetical protein [Gemmataceae bacterium]